MKSLFIALLFLSGCASFPERVRNEIHIGMSKEDVRSELGEPNSFSEDAFVYFNGYDTCKVMFMGDSVAGSTCEHDRSQEVSDGNDNKKRRFLKALAIGTQYYGNALTNSNINTTEIRCRSTNYGGDITTNCR